MFVAGSGGLVFFFQMQMMVLQDHRIDEPLHKENPNPSLCRCNGCHTYQALSGRVDKIKAGWKA